MEILNKQESGEEQQNNTNGVQQIQFLMVLVIDCTSSTRSKEGQVQWPSRQNERQYYLLLIFFNSSPIQRMIRITCYLSAEQPGDACTRHQIQDITILRSSTHPALQLCHTTQPKTYGIMGNSQGAVKKPIIAPKMIACLRSSFK